MIINIANAKDIEIGAATEGLTTKDIETAPKPEIEQNLMSFLPLVVIFAVMYFMVIRPQNKKQQEHQKKVTELKKGDKIVLTGGMVGIVVKIEDDKYMQVEIAQNVKVRFLKTAMSEIINDDKKPLPKEGD